MTFEAHEDLGVFLAHSATLESESAERFFELAEMMLVHNNRQLHDLFSRLAQYSVQHVEEVEAICAQHDLPDIKPWEFHWPEQEAPENISYENAHYLMSPEQALQQVVLAEQRARDFYQSIADKANDVTIKRHALSFAAEEQEHVDAALGMKGSFQQPSSIDQKLDMDPPHTPA